MSSFMRWRTKDGRTVAVKDMDDQHLLNTFAYARRKFKEQAGIEWFPGITGHRSSASMMADFLRAFHGEATKRNLVWKESVEKTIVDSLFVNADRVLNQPRVSTPVAPLPVLSTGTTLSIDLGDE